MKATTRSILLDVLVTTATDPPAPTSVTSLHEWGPFTAASKAAGETEGATHQPSLIR